MSKVVPNEKTALVTSDSLSSPYGHADSSFNSDDENITGNGWKSLRATISKSLRDASTHIGRIGYLGSMAIAANSLTGPAMLNLPAEYKKSGFIPTTATVVFLCALSALCCLLMANTISKVPGNSNFKKEIEYSETFEKFWGHKSFIYTQVLFFCCVTCLNVSSIVDSAQVVDTFLGHWFPGGSAGWSVAFTNSSLSVEWVRWDYDVCTEEMLVSGECIPFLDEKGILFSAGYAVVLLIFVPMALMDLKENAAWQVVGFLILLLTSMEFIYLFAKEGIHVDNITLWGSDWDSLFGVVLFNFALVIAVPAWLYEKEENVDVPTVIYSSSALSAILYIVLGTLGAMTIPNVSSNMLSSMMSGAFGTSMQICASVFAFFIIGLGCPLFSVLARMNLTGSGLVSKPVGNLLAVVLPFSISWVFYQGEAITKLLSWGGILFTSVTAFILPLLISLHSLATSTNEGSVPVFKAWGEISRQTEKRILIGLLVAAILSILAAIFGNVMN